MFNKLQLDRGKNLKVSNNKYIKQYDFLFTKLMIYLIFIAFKTNFLNLSGFKSIIPFVVKKEKESLIILKPF